MSKSNTFENDFLKLIFNATTIDGLAENDTTTPNTKIWVSLHTGALNDASVQGTNEISYTGYARIGVNRAAGATGWDVVGGNVNPGAAITFGEMSGGAGGTVTYFACGTHGVSGTGKILYWGTVTPNINVQTGVTPQLTTATVITED